MNNSEEAVQRYLKTEKNSRWISGGTALIFLILAGIIDEQLLSGFFLGVAGSFFAMAVAYHIRAKMFSELIDKIRR